MAALSPDLNSTELVWDELDRRVKAKQTASATHLWELLTVLGRTFRTIFDFHSRKKATVFACYICKN